MAVRRASWSAVSSRSSAAAFSSSRTTRLVPGIAAMSSPWARSQASATWAGVAPASFATASTSSTIRRLCSKLPSVKRGLSRAEVAGVELVARTEAAGQEAAAERRVGDEADPELAQHAAGSPPPGRASTASTRSAGRRSGGRRGRGGWSRAPPRTGRSGGPCPPRPARQRADGVLDRRGRVDAVLVVEVDVIGAEPLSDPSTAMRMFAGVLSSLVGTAVAVGDRRRTWSRARPGRGGPRSRGRRAPRSRSGP